MTVTKKDKSVEKMDRLDIAQGLWFAGFEKEEIIKLCDVTKKELNTKIKNAPERLNRFSKLNFDLNDQRIVKKLKNAIFLDIETTPVTVTTFGVGRHNKAGYAGLQKQNQVTMCSVSYISMYDFLTKGIKGIKNISGVQKKRGGEHYVCDKAITRRLEQVLTDGRELIAHNSNFDASWIRGRAAINGHKLGNFTHIDTMRLFQNQRHLCKKLDYLSDLFMGVHKLPTSMSLWNRVLQGCKESLNYMCRYNDLDVLLMVPLYLIAARFNPIAGVQMNQYQSALPRCSVTGEVLEQTSEHYNPTNGLRYTLYRNEALNLTYVNRYNTESKKAEKNLIKHVGSQQISYFTL